MTLRGRLLALGAGLLAGGLYYATGRRRRPAGVAVIYVAAALPDDWAGQLGAFWAVSVKCADGASPWRVETARELLGTAERAGCQRQGWGFHYCTSIDQAAAEGAVAGAVAAELDLSAYYWNAEKHWAGTQGQAGAADPPATAIAFARAFKAAAPWGCKLAWNAFTSETAAWFGRPGLVLDTPQAVAHFDVWAPMIYGTSAGTVARKWRSRVFKWRDRFPRMLVAPMIGSGRQASASSAWGYLWDQASGPGLASLEAERSTDWLAFWLGPGSESQWAEGNAINPSVPAILAQIKTGSTGVA
jgi:hypothetical protein